MKSKVRVTYYFKSADREDGLASAESTITRTWLGMGYESLTATAKRCMPGKDSEWMTINRTDHPSDSALTFRVSDLESIEYDEVSE